MAKGFMLFVEGGNTPQVVQPTFEAAMWQMRVLAAKNPGKEIFLFALHKRCKRNEGDKHHTPLPCHLPKEIKNNRANLSELVYKNAAKKAH